MRALATWLLFELPSAYLVDELSCDLRVLQENRTQVANEALTGDVKMLVDPRDFDSQVTIRINAKVDLLELQISGYPTFDIKYDEIELPLRTYYDRCFELSLVSAEQLVLCFDCSAHRSLYMMTIMERAFLKRGGARGTLPIWPQEIFLPTTADHSKTGLANLEALATSEKAAAPPTEAPDTSNQNIYVHVLLLKNATVSPSIVMGDLDLTDYIQKSMEVKTTTSSTTTTTPIPVPLESELDRAVRERQRKIEASVELLDAMNERTDSLLEEVPEPEIDVDMMLALEAAGKYTDFSI